MPAKRESVNMVSVVRDGYLFPVPSSPRDVYVDSGRGRNQKGQHRAVMQDVRADKEKVLEQLVGLTEKEQELSVETEEYPVSGCIWMKRRTSVVAIEQERRSRGQKKGGKPTDLGLLCRWLSLARTAGLEANWRRSVRERVDRREVVELRGERFVMTEEDTKHVVEDTATFSQGALRETREGRSVRAWSAGKVRDPTTAGAGPNVRSTLQTHMVGWKRNFNVCFLPKVWSGELYSLQAFEETAGGSVHDGAVRLKGMPKKTPSSLDLDFIMLDTGCRKPDCPGLPRSRPRSRISSS